MRGDPVRVSIDDLELKLAPPSNDVMRSDYFLRINSESRIQAYISDSCLNRIAATEHLVFDAVEAIEQSFYGSLQKLPSWRF